MNPRHALVKKLLAQDRASLLTATAELDEHLRECVTCSADTYCLIGLELLEAKNRYETTVSVLQQPLPPDASGVCRECACTDERACDPPCRWVDPEHTLCSACAPPVNYSLTEGRP